jgi:5'-deoxynucleotidase YfbR-like HD superfamily hydrolase
VSRLSDLLSLSYVGRWAITPMFRNQTVAEHSFRVAAIALEISSTMFKHPDDSPEIGFRRQCEVIYWALVHDATEAYTGDLPSPFKSHLGKNVLWAVERQLCPWWAELQATIHDDARAIVHVADTIEALSWVTRHSPDSKWKFKPYPDRPMVDVLYDRITEETKSYIFMKPKTVPGLMEAVEAVLKELGLWRDTNTNPSTVANSSV